jgi:YihY family inner membrane protein
MTRYLPKHPGRFILQVLKGFRANQGLLLSGAVAYYMLLSIVPLFTFLPIVLSRVVEPNLLMTTLTRFLVVIMPGGAALVAEQVANILAHPEIAGWVLLLVLLFFSSMAFAIIENAMSIIFSHRAPVRRRHFLTSALLPYLFIVLLGLGLLLTTVMSTALKVMTPDEIELLGREWSLGWLPVVLLYLSGFVGEVLMLTAIYMVMPVGRPKLRHALAGGISAGVLWELTRHVLAWYFSTLSMVSVVYGTLATTIVALLTFEVAAIILLLGAQVIAEYERVMR